MNRPSSQADAFASAVGARAGIASPAALFAREPDAEARKQAARLHAAVDEGNYAAVLDALRLNSAAASQRPLSRALIDDLILRAVSEHRQHHQDDARALSALLELDEPDEQVLADVDAAEAEAVAHLQQLLAQPTISAGELREEVIRLVYSELADAVAGRLEAQEGDGAVLHLLGPVRRAAFEEQLTQRDLALTDTIADMDWRAQLQRVCTPGLAEHNREALREELRSSVEGALWQVLGEQTLPRVAA